MTIVRSRGGAISATLVTLLALLLVVSPASAKTFEITYDWNDARFGAQGWRVDNAPPTDALGTPWYATTHTVGAGLKIVPTGGTRPYRDARGTWAWDPPAGASLRRARIEGLDGKAVQRQFARAWLVVGGEPPEARSNLRELGYDGTGQPSAEWTNRSYSLITPAGKDGVGFVLWLFTIPCESLEEPSACVPVAPSDGASLSLRKAVFTVDDPSKPTVTVDGLPEGTMWTRNRQVRVKVASADPQSGIAKVEAVVRDGAEARTINLGQWNPDRFHVATRAPGTPPLEVARGADRTVTVARSGTTRLSFRATNGAGATTTTQAQVRVDRDRPDIDWPRKLGPGDALRVADSPSGIASATLMVNGRARDTCTNARSCRLVVPSDVSDRARVAVRVADRAGNERSGDRTVRVAGVAKDRRSPRIEWPRKVKPGSSVVVVDDGSGVADATLSIVGAGAETDRCGGGQRRCEVRVPATAAGEQIRLAATDRAGNRTESTRRVLERVCRPRSICPKPAKPHRTSLLTYPTDAADLWAGPLRFRWKQPALKGVRAPATLWYRLELDGEEAYAGPELSHEEFGVDVGDHEWRVSVYANASSARKLMVATSRFRMTEFGSAGGQPTDTDDLTASQGLPSSRSTTIGAKRMPRLLTPRPGMGSGPIRSAQPGPASPRAGQPGIVDSLQDYPRSLRDMATRFMPRIHPDGGERWAPLDIPNFLAEPGSRCGVRSGTCEDTKIIGGGFPRPTIDGEAARIRLPTYGPKSDVERYQTGRGIRSEGGDPRGCLPRRRGKVRDRLECAGEMTLYFTISKAGAGLPANWQGMWAIDYWWFWRYNDAGSGGTYQHEGDWEGVTVYVDPSRKFSRDVAFRQHAGIVHYFGDGGHLKKWDGNSENGPAIRDNVGKGLKGPNVYSASGRHGSYPVPGSGIDVPADAKVLGVVDLPDGAAIGAGENYDGKRRWAQRCHPRLVVCLDAFPVTRRASYVAGPTPAGWGGYSQQWGGSKASPAGPGFGANEGPFRRPFSTLQNDVIKPRSTSAAPTVRAKPCGSWFGAAVTVLVCGHGGPPPDARLVVRRREGTETWGPGDARLGPGWAIQRVGAVPSSGDRIELQVPSRSASEVLVRLAGTDGQPFVTRIDGATVSEGASFVVRTVEGVPRLVDRGTGLPAGTVTAGLQDKPVRMASLRVRKTTARLRITDSPDLRRLRLRLTADRGTLGSITVAGPGRDEYGYRTFTFRVPEGTRAVRGQMETTSGRRLLVAADANVEIFRPEPRVQTDNEGGPSGSGRPTE